MGHNLAKTNGEYAFASVKEIPWHKLGRIVERKMTAAECIKMAGLDYEVGITPAQLVINERVKEMPGQYVTYREDTDVPLGIVGGRYEVVQNREAFAFFDSIVGSKAAIYETAGALGRGERIFITAKLPKHILVGKDVIDQYLFLTSTHDGDSSIQAAFTPVRIVCQNTLQAAIGQRSRVIKIRHTGNAKQNLEQAHKMMGIVAQQSERTGEAFTAMRKVKITDKALRNFIVLAMHPQREQLVGGKEIDLSVRFVNTVSAIEEYALSHETQQTPETKGTLYGAYNAITGYFQNVKDYKSDNAKLKSVIGGTASRKGSHALSIAIGVLANKIQLQ